VSEVPEDLTEGLWSDKVKGSPHPPGIGLISVKKVVGETVHFHDPICGYKYQWDKERFLRVFNRFEPKKNA
jgi:hypothetical protein